ncbi:MAG: membrane-fusion protein [Moraxellaceae bacterium]|nr:MAG: membrane-fusion protein [Moraxellaceae bacterium]
MDFPGEKLVIKMWETLVEKGVGGALQPWQEKRLGKARNQIRKDELLILAAAEKDAANIRSGNAVYTSLLEHDGKSLPATHRVEPTINLDSLSEIANNTNQYEAIRKEVNVSNSIVVAENILANDHSEAPEEKIDEDWLYSWRDYAGRTSSEELQELWGRVLAEEIKGPGSYSFRTLEFLKGLSKSEAEIMSNVAQFVVAGRIWRGKEKFLEKEGVKFNELLFLQDLGILSGVDGAGLNTTWNSISEDKYMKALISHDMAIGIEHKDKEKKIVDSVYILTNLGQQVLGLANFNANKEYLESIAQDYANQEYDVILGDWKQTTPSVGQIRNEVKIEAEAKA